MSRDFDLLKEASQRLSDGEHKAAVVTRSLALSIQKLCANARKVALSKGREVKDVKRASRPSRVIKPKEPKAPKPQNNEPLHLVMMTEAGEIKVFDFPRLGQMPQNGVPELPIPEASNALPSIPEEKESEAVEEKEKPAEIAEEKSELIAEEKESEVRSVDPTNHQSTHPSKQTHKAFPYRR